MTLRRLTQTGVARLSASFCSLKEALPFYRMERFQTIPFSDEMYCISKLQIETEGFALAKESGLRKVWHQLPKKKLHLLPNTFLPASSLSSLCHI